MRLLCKLALISASLLFLLPTEAVLANTEVLVRGKVVDEKGEPLPDVRITLTRVDDPEWQEELKTKRNGRFKIFLRDGAHEFDVRLEKDGYQITTGRIEPIVHASAEERQMGLGSASRGNFNVDFTMSSLIAEMQTVSAQEAYNKGTAAARQRQFDEAIEYFQRTLEMDENHQAARLAMARAYHDSRRPAEAADLLAIILEAENVAPSTLELSYHVMRDAGRLEEAATALDRLWNKSPQTAAEELFELATLWRSRGDKEQARIAVERVLEIRPNQANAHYFYARLLYVMEEPEPAVRHFRRFLELKPTSPLAEGVAKRIHEIEAELSGQDGGVTGDGASS